MVVVGIEVVIIEVVMLVIVVMVVVSWFGNGDSVQYRAKIATCRPTICTCIYPTCMLHA